MSTITSFPVAPDRRGHRGLEFTSTHRLMERVNLAFESLRKVGAA